MAKSGVVNLRGFINKLEKRIVKNPERKLKKMVQRSTALVEGTTKQSILKGGTGKTYQKYNPRRTHTASAKGEPPASDTGFLVSNITSSVRKQGTSVVGQIVASAPYAPWLEFGTSTIEKRPFMQPALERNRPKIKRIFKEGGYIK
jgi:HK97 gp10 family phage protein|tara:strand:- start:156 stop:593 length:438 start_codon:yes stop_codon:yes gene_type:complete